MNELFLNQYNQRVKIGLEIGEHVTDYENFLVDLQQNYNLEKIDFILIHMKPIDINKRLWNEWADFFKQHQIFFAFLYTQQRGAPKGKVSHLTKEIVYEMKQRAGAYFLGDMIGETGGLVSWPEGYYEENMMDKIVFEDMQQAKDHYVQYVSSRVKIDREFNVPAVLAVEATTLTRYNYEAGVDYSFAEMMCGNPEIIFASVRGASKAYEKDWWASHIAQEWYGGFRNNDPLKYKRLKLAYYYSFLAGAQYIYPESGNYKIGSYGDDYDVNSKFCKEYRKVWNDFADFVHLHQRPNGYPKVKIGFLQGNLDSWTGWGGTTVWNQFHKDEWIYDDAERGWEYLNQLYVGEKWHTPTVYGEKDTTTSIPYGQYDIVPIEASIEVLKQYSCLVMLGWNTMTEEHYKKLKDYVYGGGQLFMSVPHLNTSSKRSTDWQLIYDGNYSELFGCKIKGKGAEVNWGAKFIAESTIPDYLYPYTKNGICDPICAGGKISCAEVEVTTGKVIAVLADKFRRWRDTSPTILIENSYGKGVASLLTTWDYPGAVCLDKLMRVILRTIMNGEQQDTDIQVIANDRIHYAIYEVGKLQKVVYLLNTDYNVSNYTDIIYGDSKLTINIESCEMSIVYLTDNVLVAFDSLEVTVEEIQNNGKTMKIFIKGNNQHTVKITSSDKMQILFDQNILNSKDNNYHIDLQKDTVHQLVILKD